MPCLAADALYETTRSELGSARLRPASCGNPNPRSDTQWLHCTWHPQNRCRSIAPSGVRGSQTSCCLVQQSPSLRKDVDGLSGDALANIGWVFPAQNAEGAHMNLSGGGVAAHSPNRDNAVTFMEYLTSDQAQQYFSAGNDEYPAVPGVGLSPSFAALGLFRPDAVDLTEVAKNVPEAQMIFNQVGWE